MCWCPSASGAGVAPGTPGTFLAEARAAAAAWKATTRCLPEPARAPAPYLGRGPALPFCLPLDQSHLNVLPEAREPARVKIVPDHRLWGTGGAGPGNHLLSSPVQMANALGAARARRRRCPSDLRRGPRDGGGGDLRTCSR